VTSTPALSDQIRRYGANVRDFFHAGERASLVSPIFNVPARLVTGSYCYFEHLPWLLREVEAAAEPEELGRRMKGVAIRPNYVNLNALMLGYFNGREQLRLRQALAADEPLPEERRGDDELLIDFWHRVGSVYVEGDAYLPSETGYRLPILPESAALELAGRTRELDAGRRTSVRRTIAVAELYTFILNGEARVGVFHHGPYPLEGGDVLVVKELVGLRDDFLPWELDERPPIDSLARVMRLRDVDAKIDLFGSLIADPFEFDDRIASEAVVTPAGDGVRELGADELAELERVTADGQMRMYVQAAEWSPDYQVAYGADLYASLALSFARLAGLRLDDEVKRRFHATAERVVPGLRSGEDAPLVLKRLGATDGDLYSPAVPV
jgi:hypothetical protein